MTKEEAQDIPKGDSMERKFQGIGDIDNKKLRNVIDTLECAIGACDSIIPSEILQDAVAYLELLSYERSWYGCDEDMGS